MKQQHGHHVKSDLEKTNKDCDEMVSISSSLTRGLGREHFTLNMRLSKMNLNLVKF